MKYSFDDKNARNEKFNKYSLNKESIIITKSFSVGFCAWDSSKLLKIEWYFHEMQPLFGEHILELQDMDIDVYIF